MERACRRPITLLLVALSLCLRLSEQDSTKEWCQPVNTVIPGRALDVAFVATGTQRWAEFQVALVSILHFRSCPLVLHFLGANETRAHIEHLLSDRYQHLALQFHDLPEIAVSSALPEMHKPAAFHLALDDVISSTSTGYLLSLDVDIVLTNDICAVLGEFDHMQAVAPSALFGLVPEISTWYTFPGRRGIPFPVQPPLQISNGREAGTAAGLNSGVVLWHLNATRAWGWFRRWQEELPHILLTHNITDRLLLPDQDTMNLMGRIHPEIVHVVDLKWNFQVLPIQWDWGTGRDPKFQHAVVIHLNAGATYQRTFWRNVTAWFSGHENDERCARRPSIQRLWASLAPL